MTDDNEASMPVAVEMLPNDADMRLITPALTAAVRKVFDAHGFKWVPVVILCVQRMGEDKATVAVVRNVEADVKSEMVEEYGEPS